LKENSDRENRTNSLLNVLKFTLRLYLKKDATKAQKHKEYFFACLDLSVLSDQAKNGENSEWS